MTTREKILDSLAPIVAAPSHVRIDEERLRTTAADLLEAPVPPWDNHLQLLGTPEETAQYYFFLDSTNFCFWAPKGKERWAYPIDGKWVSGYYAYSRAVKDAFLRDARLFNADHLSAMAAEEFEKLFAQGRNELLLLSERHRLINENFTILKERFNGNAMELLRQANRDADTLVALLLEHFPSFRDETSWRGHTAYIYKRAQIFPSDISFTGLDALKISNLDHLTVFADYKLPQMLEYLGVLVYSDELDADIRNESLIPSGSEKEVELRASSIVAIERMRDEMVRLGRTITQNELDWILWVKAKGTEFKKPHHKTLSIFY